MKGFYLGNMFIYEKVDGMNTFLFPIMLSDISRLNALYNLFGRERYATLLLHDIGYAVKDCQALS